jgi:hypothetical protein
MNKENTFSNLAVWCKSYYEKTKLKVHPSSVPVELVLEDVLGYVAILLAHDKGMATAFDALNVRVKDLELLVHQLTEQLVTENADKEISSISEERYVPIEIDEKSGIVKSITTKKVKK